MIKFFFKLIIFGLPVFAVLLLPSVMFIIGHEYYSVSDVVSTQLRTPDALYNPCCSNLKKEYKVELVGRRQSAVVIIGTSRVLTIKSNFFKQPEQVTNAGQILTSLDELPKIQNILKDKTKLVILGLDPQMFNPDFVSQDIPSHMDGNVLEGFGNLLGTYWKKFYADLFSGRMNMSTVWNNRDTSNVGLVALQTLAGFRSDGSFEYGPEVLRPEYEERKLQTMRLSVRSLAFDRLSWLYGEKINDVALGNLNDFLAFCKENKIEVVGFLSPQPHEIYAEIAKVSDTYSYNQVELPKDIQKIFEKDGYTFIDFSDGGTIGLQNTDFIDSVHGGESAYKKILLKLSQSSKMLRDLLAITG